MNLLISIDEEIYRHAQNVSEDSNDEWNAMRAIANGTPIPDNATNGDVIKAIFPYGKYSEYFADVEMKTEENDTRFKSVFDRDWWDQPYQKGDTNEKQVRYL